MHQNNILFSNYLGNWPAYNYALFRNQGFLWKNVLRDYIKFILKSNVNDRKKIGVFHSFFHPWSIDISYLTMPFKQSSLTKSFINFKRTLLLEFIFIRGLKRLNKI